VAKERSGGGKWRSGGVQRKKWRWADEKWRNQGKKWSRTEGTCRLPEEEVEVSRGRDEHRQEELEAAKRTSGCR
jgi:hypothetical protein